MGNWQALGRDIESLYVKELGGELSRDDIYKVLVLDMMEGAIEVDWRDFFPYLKWIPNRSMEMKIQNLHSRREAVMKALMIEQKKKMESGKVGSWWNLLEAYDRVILMIWLFGMWQVQNCYFDYLLTEANDLSEDQICMLIWETIIETSDTTLVTTEWAMYELARDKTRQVVVFPSASG